MKAERKSLKKQQEEQLNELFKNPLLHREIQGERVFVPLDTKRLWNI